MKLTISIILLLFLTGVPVSVLAENPAHSGPEVIKLKMGDLMLPFKHWAHQKFLEKQCSPCHVSKIGKIENWGKETAHALCITCHESRHKGPVECKQCHGSFYSRK